MKLNFTQAQISQTLGHVLALLVGYVAAKQGGGLSAQDSAEVAAGLSVIVGPLASKLFAVEQSPEVQSVDVENIAQQVMSIVAESQASPRSALSAVAAEPAQADTASTAVESPAKPADGPTQGIITPPPPPAS